MGKRSGTVDTEDGVANLSIAELDAEIAVSVHTVSANQERLPITKQQASNPWPDDSGYAKWVRVCDTEK